MPPEESSEEKTEEPTERKKRDAREKGQVAQSSEVNNFLVLLTAAIMLWFLSARILATLEAEVTDCLGNLAEIEVGIEGAVHLIQGSMMAVGNCWFPFAASVVAAGLLAGGIQTRALFSLETISPDLQKMNPVNGFRNLVSWEAIVRMVTAFVKFALIGIILWFVVGGRLSWVRGVMGRTPRGILEVGAYLSFLVLLWVSAGQALVAVGDYAWQYYQHYKKLKMSKTELKEERKKDEGNPEIRRVQEERRNEMAASRMMEEVPAADVVVTNPTRIAVALKWDAGSMNAPQVVAKGRRNMAARIKKLARDNDVPVVERKPLARALDQSVEVGMEVPPKLYFAVAKVLSFVMQGDQEGLGSSSGGLE